MEQDIVTIRHRSPWSTRDKILRMLWGAVQATFFRCSLHNAYRWRSLLLRMFGAKVASNVKFRRTAHIEIPWKLTIGKGSSVGDHAILYCLDTITIGDFVMVSQYAHLCAGTHDSTSRAMQLVTKPIVIGDDVWVAADAFVGPGVTIGDRSILSARSTLFKDLPPDVIAMGNPAVPIKPRIFNQDPIKGS